MGQALVKSDMDIISSNISTGSLNNEFNFLNIQSAGDNSSVASLGSRASSLEFRKKTIIKFWEKKQYRKQKKEIKYECRKKLAD